MAMAQDTKTFSRASAQAVRASLDAFKVNDWAPLMGNSTDFFRQAHGLLGFITCVGNLDTINSSLRGGALEAVETLMSMGLFLADAERIMEREA